jgi:hypothetical protein
MEAKKSTLADRSGITALLQGKQQAIRPVALAPERSGVFF